MLTETFLKHVKKTETCWLWRGKPNNSGYGSAYFDGRREGAHRISYRMTYGAFDRRLFVLHSCDTPLCVRPDHLFLGTQTDNMQDASKKGRLDFPRWVNQPHPRKGKKGATEKQRQAMSKAKERPFRITSPTGEVIDGVNLTKFCKGNGLNQGRTWQVINGHAASHKGYTRAP